jgi:hypothetical protein
MSRSRIRPYLGPFMALLIVLALGAGTVYAAKPKAADGTSAGSTTIDLTTATKTFTVGALSNASDTVLCPVGRVVGGGFSQSAYDVHITDSRPQGTNAWRVWADNPGESDRLVTAYAVCMTTES